MKTNGPLLHIEAVEAIGAADALGDQMPDRARASIENLTRVRSMHYLRSMACSLVVIMSSLESLADDSRERRAER
jgi:hypothetical protein